MYEQGTTAEWPNLERKTRGMFVENVHPCNRGRYPFGVVEWVEGAPLEQVFVRLGRGSTCYGPAQHWRPTSTKPEWLERLELEAAA